MTLKKFVKFKKKKKKWNKKFYLGKLNIFHVSLNVLIKFIFLSNVEKKLLVFFGEIFLYLFFIVAMIFFFLAEHFSYLIISLLSWHCSTNGK